MFLSLIGRAGFINFAFTHYLIVFSLPTHSGDRGGRAADALLAERRALMPTSSWPRRQGEDPSSAIEWAWGMLLAGWASHRHGQDAGKAAASLLLCASPLPSASSSITSFSLLGRRTGANPPTWGQPQTVSQFGGLGNRRGEGSPWDPRASPRRRPPVARGLRAHEGARSRAQPAVRGTAPALASSPGSLRYFFFPPKNDFIIIFKEE